MSGRKSNLNSYKSLASVSMTANVVSSATNIQYLDNIGVQFNFTGASIGSFSVQVSADYMQDTQGVVTSAGNWVPLTLSPTPSANATSGTIYLDLNQLSAPWIRVAYTANSGTGTLSAYITGKMV